MAIASFIAAPGAAPADDAPLVSAADLAAILGVDNTTAERLSETATALVERFAANAPDTIKSEAVIRCAGWLHESPAGGVRMEAQGEVRTAYSPAMTGALRSSGAMALLGPWKIRRAGVVA